MDGGAWWAAVHGVAKSWTWLSDSTFAFHFHALEKEMATHSSVLARRIPGMREPSRLPSVGSHRVGHDWSHSAAATSWGNTNCDGNLKSYNFLVLHFLNRWFKRPGWKDTAFWCFIATRKSVIGSPIYFLSILCFPVSEQQFIEQLLCARFSSFSVAWIWHVDHNVRSINACGMDEFIEMNFNNCS